MAVTVVGMLAALTSSVQSQEFTSPDDLLSTLYQAYLSAPVTNFEPYFSDRLTAEMAGGRLDRRVLQGLGADPLLGGERASLVTMFNLDTIEPEGLTATSVASFQSGGKPVTIRFQLVREDDHGWQIDHIKGQSGDFSWCSSDLIAAARASPP